MLDPVSLPPGRHEELPLRHLFFFARMIGAGARLQAMVDRPRTGAVGRAEDCIVVFRSNEWLMQPEKNRRHSRSVRNIPPLGAGFVGGGSSGFLVVDRLAAGPGKGKVFGVEPGVVDPAN